MFLLESICTKLCLKKMQNDDHFTILKFKLVIVISVCPWQDFPTYPNICE